jgi:aminoglycoside N3'-acetyltransferase
MFWISVRDCSSSTHCSELGRALIAFEDKMAELLVSKRELVQQLLDLGVKPGDVLLVHTSFSKIRPVEEGPQGLIAALRLALGPEGTLVDAQHDRR